MNEKIAKICEELVKINQSVDWCKFNTQEAVNQLSRIADLLAYAINKEANDGEGN